MVLIKQWKYISGKTALAILKKEIKVPYTENNMKPLEMKIETIKRYL